MRNGAEWMLDRQGSGQIVLPAAGKVHKKLIVMQTENN